MLRILTPEEQAAAGPMAGASPAGSTDGVSPERKGAEGIEELQDYEIVLGRRQIASLSFVGCVILVIFSGASYMLGKAAAGSQTTNAAAAAKTPAPAAPGATSTSAPTPAAQTAGPASAGQPAPAPRTVQGIDDVIKTAPPVSADEAKLFGEPVPGALYIQVGAVDRGPALVLTSGLVSRGFPALIAPGPSGTFRVLVGPFKDSADYVIAKTAVDRMGITAFARQYTTN